MPWCPKCRQEYRATIVRCADCESDLVADLATHDRALQAAAATRMVRIVAPGGTLTALAAGLRGRGIPLEEDPEGGGLLAPEAAAEVIESSIAQVAEYERVGDTLHVYGPRQDLEPELKPDPSWLDRSDADLAAQPDAAIAGLVGLCASPVARYRARAAARLAAFCSERSVPIADVVVWTAKSRLKKALFGWAVLLAEQKPAGLSARLVAEARRSEPHVASLLLHTVSLLRDPSVLADLLPLLDHEESMVRDDADEALVSLAGFDVGFEAEAEPAVRARSIQLWREWIVKRGSR